MPENTAGKNQRSASKEVSLLRDEQVTSENLPKNVSLQLYELMKSVVQNDVNPSTVRAACACATEIHRMLKLNQEIKRSGL